MASPVKKSLKRKLRKISDDGEKTENIKSVRLELRNDKDGAGHTDFVSDEPVCDIDLLSRTDLTNETAVELVDGKTSQPVKDGAVQAPSPSSASASTCSDTVTEEERNRFAFISQQLDILNSPAGQTRLFPKSPVKWINPTTQSKKVIRKKGLKIKVGLTEKHRLAVVKKAILSPRYVEIDCHLFSVRSWFCTAY